MIRVCEIILERGDKRSLLNDDLAALFTGNKLEAWKYDASDRRRRRIIASHRRKGGTFRMMRLFLVLWSHRFKLWRKHSAIKSPASVSAQKTALNLLWVCSCTKWCNTQSSFQVVLESKVLVPVNVTSQRMQHLSSAFNEWLKRQNLNPVEIEACVESGM